MHLYECVKQTEKKKNAEHVKPGHVAEARRWTKGIKTKTLFVVARSKPREENKRLIPIGK